MSIQSSFQGNAVDLLNQLENILLSDPLIDEVGFLHPSQIVQLSKNAGPSLDSSADYMPSTDDSVVINFWITDHKLAISTEVLQLLYKAARHAFTVASQQYELFLNLQADKISTDSLSTSESFLENEVMRHSKALLLFCYNYETAWNSRKLVASRKQTMSLCMEELQFSALILSYAPKSEQAWSHRRWVIKMINATCQNMHDILERESKLVEKTAEGSKMNYRAWYHRCWLVSYMSRKQVFDEFNQSRKWADLHIADNCCFHYRRRLMLMMLDEVYLKPNSMVSDLCIMWKEELQWNELLIKRFVGREALWIHRRFLSQCWMKHFLSDEYSQCSHLSCPSRNQDLGRFLNQELQLVQSCLIVTDNGLEDTEAQAELATSYILWISKQIPGDGGTDFREELMEMEDLKRRAKLSPVKLLLCDV